MMPNLPIMDYEGVWREKRASLRSGLGQAVALMALLAPLLFL
jgi:hypothetical protein